MSERNETKKNKLRHTGLKIDRKTLRRKDILTKDGVLSTKTCSAFVTLQSASIFPTARVR